MPKFDASMIDTEAVRVRALEQAAAEARIVRSEARRFLYRPVEEGILSQDISDAVADSKAHQAAEKFIQEKNAGLHNDKCNITARGVTALIFSSGKRGIEQRLEDQELGIFTPTFEKVGEVTGDDSRTDVPARSIYKLELPDGYYEAYPKSFNVTLYRAVQLHHSGVSHHQGMMPGFDHHFLRIVGSGGELWQNPDYKLDGTRATPAVVDLDISSIRS